MVKQWLKDWRETPRQGRIPLYIISTIMLLLCIDGAVYNLRLRSYADVAAEPVLFLFLLSIFALWPFLIATAIRKRGGSFTIWVYLAIIFSGPVIGIAYLARWRGRPKTVVHLSDGELLNDRP